MPRIKLMEKLTDEQRLARYAGSGGMCREEVLEDMLAFHNLRIAPLVDTEFMRLYLFLFAEALANENWERCVEVARQAYAAAQAKRTDVPRRDEVLALPLAMTKMPMRTLEMLERNGIRYVSDLLARRREDLLAIPQFSSHSLQDCYDALAELGLTE